MRVFERDGLVREGKPRIQDPEVASEPVRIKLRDRNRNDYTTVYLSANEAREVGRLVGLHPWQRQPSASGMICEVHPTEVWPHLVENEELGLYVDCAGPGMPWTNALRLLRGAKDRLALAEVTAGAERDLAGIALEDAEVGEWLRIRVDIAAREAIEESLAGVIFNEASLVRRTPVDGTIRTLLDLRGFERIPEPEKPPSVMLTPFGGYKRVALTYFTHVGKRYTEGEFWTPQDRLDFQVYAMVETLRADGKLPGFIEGVHWPYGSILVSPTDGVDALLPPIDKADEDEG